MTGPIHFFFLFSKNFYRAQFDKASNNNFVKALSDTPGLIYEEIAPLIISNIDWTIIQRVDLSAYFEKGPQLLALLEQVHMKCMQRNFPCQHRDHLADLERQVRDTLSERDRIVGLLSANKTNARVRARRSLLPFVGKIANYLFGTLDEDAEAKLVQYIETAHNDTRKVAALLANQTELFKLEFGDFDNKLKNITDLVSTLASLDVTREQDRALGAATESLAENVLQYSLDTETLADAVLFSAQGAVHPRFLSPEIIQNSANVIEETLVDTALPATDSILSLIKISIVTILFRNNQLIYHLTIPLVSNQRFNLVKFTPVPVETQVFNSTTAFAYIWPNEPYVSIDSVQNLYFPITLDAVDKCKKIDDCYICRHTEPVRKIQPETPCEIRIYSQGESANLEYCDFRLVKLPVTFWSRLHRPNTWLFSTKEPETTFINCPRDKPNTVVISGVGLLKLRPGCIAIAPTARMTGSQRVNMRVESVNFTLPGFNISTILRNLTENENLSEGFQSLNHEIDGLKVDHKLTAESLQAGIGLDSIIREARAVSRYRRIATNFDGFEKQAIVYGSSAIALLVVLFLLSKAGTLGGPLAFLCCRMFSDTSQSTASGQGAPAGPPPQTPASASVARADARAPDVRMATLQPARPTIESRRLEHAPSLPTLYTTAKGVRAPSTGVIYEGRMQSTR